MLCDSIKIWFNDYLDGDLNPKKKETVETHLEQCSHCRQEFNRLKQADDYLRLEVKRMFMEIPVPDGLFSKIEDRIKKDGTRPPFYKRLQSSFAGVAAVLLIFAVANGMFYKHFDGKIYEAVDRASLPEIYNPAQESGSGLDSDIQTEIPGGPAGGVSMVIQDQSVNSDELKRLMEFPDRPVVGGTGTVDVKDKDVEDYIKPKENSLNDDSGAGKPAGTEKGVSPAAMTAIEPSKKLGATAKRPDGIQNRTDVDSAIGGIIPLMPSYLPEGAVLKNLTSEKDRVYIDYAAGNSQFGIEEKLVTEEKVLLKNLSEGKKVKINGQDGTLLGATPAGRVTLIFKQNSLLITIEGELPVEEILRIAESLR